MPTSVPLPRSRIAAMKGWKVAAMPTLLTASVRAMTSMSARSAVSMPTLMPALATTTSGTPWRARQAWPAATTLSMSATSASYTCQRSAGQSRARAQSRSSTGRRATRASRQPSAKQRSAKAWPMPLDAPVR